MRKSKDASKTIFNDPKLWGKNMAEIRKRKKMYNPNQPKPSEMGYEIRMRFKKNVSDLFTDHHIMRAWIYSLVESTLIKQGKLKKTKT